MAVVCDIPALLSVMMKMGSQRQPWRKYGRLVVNETQYYQRLRAIRGANGETPLRRCVGEDGSLKELYRNRVR